MSSFGLNAISKHCVILLGDASVGFIKEVRLLFKEYSLSLVY